MRHPLPPAHGWSGLTWNVVPVLLQQLSHLAGRGGAVLVVMSKSCAALQPNKLVRWLEGWRCTSRSDWPASLTWDRWSALSQWAGKPHSIADTFLRWTVVLYVVELVRRVQFTCSICLICTNTVSERVRNSVVHRHFSSYENAELICHSQVSPPTDISLLFYRNIIRNLSNVH